MRRVLLALSLISSVLLSAGDAWARTNREAFCDPARRCFASEASTCGSGRTCAINTVVDAVCGLTTVGQGRCLAAEDLTCMNTESCLSREAVEPVRVERSICCRCGLSTARDRCVSFTNVDTCAADTIDRHPSMIAYHNRSGATADSPQVQCDPVQLSEQECLPVAQNGTCQNRAADVVTVFTAQADPNAGPGLIDRASDALTGAVRPPITPNLSVPIPGLTFATPEAAGGTVRVNFLGQYIAAVYRYAMSIVVVVATIMVVYGGFLYLVSPIAGKAAKGKEIIKDALMGTVVLLSAYLILNTVNPQLTNLRSLSLEEILPVTDAIHDSSARDEENNTGPNGTAQSVPANTSELCTTAPARDASPAIRRPFAQAAATCTDYPPTTIPTQITASYCSNLNATVSDGSIRKRMRAKVTLVPQLTGSARDHLAWCANCADHFSCSAPERTDEQCVRLAGRNGEGVPCAGGFGLFLRGMTANCHGKRFDRMDGLDGLTFGIQDTNAWDLPGMLRDFEQTDRDAFLRVFANADLAAWYQNGSIRADWFCEQQVRQNGLACNANFRRGLEAAMRERGMIIAQLRRAYADYTRFTRIASAHFRSVKGQAMFAAWLNNPGRCGGSLAPLVQACGRLPEEEKYECFLREAVNVPCRNNATGAASRAQSIRTALANIPFSVTAGEIEPLDALINRCLPR